MRTPWPLVHGSFSEKNKYLLVRYGSSHPNIPRGHAVLEICFTPQSCNCFSTTVAFPLPLFVNWGGDRPAKVHESAACAPDSRRTSDVLGGLRGYRGERGIAH